MITQDNYLDLGNLFFNELIGSTTLSIVLGLVVISFLCIKNRVPMQPMVGLNVLWVALMISYAMNVFVWAISIFVLGLLGYSMYIKMLKR